MVDKCAAQLCTGMLEKTFAGYETPAHEFVTIRGVRQLKLALVGWCLVRRALAFLAASTKL